ncbi:MULTISPECIES: YitT family protein [Vagococcus]|uniref:YitT family protein n=1 Tax=Vagococcus TaxID=2737 RepID=UPI002FC7604F
MVKEEIKKLLIILIGNVIMAFSYAQWMVPNRLINGGVTSLAMVIGKLTNSSLVIWTNGLTLCLLFISLIFLGKQIFLRSVFSSVSYMTLFSFFYSFPIPVQINLEVDLLLASIGIAIGYYCSISSGSTTVGLDIIALIAHKKNSKIKIAKVIRYCNYSVLGLGLITYGIKSVVVGVIFSFLYSGILDWLLKIRGVQISEV